MSTFIRKHCYIIMENRKSKNLIKILAIGFILVVCPAASWYYLQKGLNYQKDARKELVAKQKLVVEDFVPQYIKTDSTFLKNKLRLIILNDGQIEKASLKELTDKLTDQFEESKGVFLLEMLAQQNSESLSTDLVSDMHVRKIISKSEYQNIVSNKIGKPVFKMQNNREVVDKIEKGLALNNDSKAYAVFVDHKNKIRNFYDLADEKRIKSMVEHMAILIPRKDIEKAELIREKEM